MGGLWHLPTDFKQLRLVLCPKWVKSGCYLGIFALFSLVWVLIKSRWSIISCVMGIILCDASTVLFDIPIISFCYIHNSSCHALNLLANIPSIIFIISSDMLQISCPVCGASFSLQQNYPLTLCISCAFDMG